MEHQPIVVGLSTGASFPIRPFVTKKGDGVWWCLRNPSTNKPAVYGVHVPVEATKGSFPESITIDGQTFRTERNEKGGVKAGGTVEIDSVKHRVQFSLNPRKNGGNTLYCKVFKAPSGGGGSTAYDFDLL